VQATRVRDEFWYAQRFGLDWPKLATAPAPKQRGFAVAARPQSSRSLTASPSPSPVPSSAPSNHPPVAIDDLVVVTGPAAGVLEIDVLANDYDPDLWDELEVIDIGSSVHGASITTDGKKVSYEFPAGESEEFSWGAVLTWGEDPPTSGGSIQQVELHDGIRGFEDEFSYTISDSLGLTVSAFVQVKQEADKDWVYRRKPKYDEREEIGIDGKPGYEILVEQKLTKKEGILFSVSPKTQTWQKNVQSALNYYVDTEGELQYQPTPKGGRPLLDTNDVKAGLKAEVVITDKLGLKQTDKAAETLFILEQVKKRLGLNKPGQNLPVPEPEKQPWVPNAEELALVDEMVGPFLEGSTYYVFLNKKKLEELAAAGTVSEETMTKIKGIIAGFGLDWDALDDTYEGLRITDDTAGEELGKWDTREEE
jgi:hypothetical protein